MNKDYTGVIILVSIVVLMIAGSLATEKVVRDKGGKTVWIWEENPFKSENP